jgi:hypothetical protein
MESYVERWLREQRKPVKKSGGRRKQQKETQVREETRREEETQDGKNSRSKGHETP